jgi:hypothetical protein
MSLDISDLLIIAAGVCLGKFLSALACGAIAQICNPVPPEEPFWKRAFRAALMFVSG